MKKTPTRKDRASDDAVGADQDDFDMGAAALANVEKRRNLNAEELATRRGDHQKNCAHRHALRIGPLDTEWPLL